VEAKCVQRRTGRKFGCSSQGTPKGMVHQLLEVKWLDR
jgi:hypothetical protein